MRFELLTRDQKIRFLQRLHNRLNNICFNGELKPVVIDIENLNKDETNISAIYGARWKYNNDIMNEEMQKCIIFSLELIDDVSMQDKQSEQFYLLASVLHHEMIHQYCDENGIEDRESPDNDHNQSWAKAAEEHGLSVRYDECGKLIANSSWAALWLKGTMRIR